MGLKAIEQAYLSPSERLLREILTLSCAEAGCEISDVIVIWTDAEGIQHMRSAANELKSRSPA